MISLNDNILSSITYNELITTITSNHDLSKIDDIDLLIKNELENLTVLRAIESLKNLKINKEFIKKELK